MVCLKLSSFVNTSVLTEVGIFISVQTLMFPPARLMYLLMDPNAPFSHPLVSASVAQGLQVLSGQNV